MITGGEVPIHDTVKCEPQGGNNPYHPPTYWYDVTPGAFGRCDFHVMVFDSIATNYSNWVEPVGWQHLLHKVGNDWWVSWWSPGCVNAIFSTFRFQFDNPNPAVWGDWTTTIDGTSNPFAQVIDSSGNHSGEPDGYGYRFHVPLLPVPGCDFVPGDANGDGNVMGNDVTYSVRYFKGLGPNPPDSCWNDSTQNWLYSGGDANGNCQYGGSDVTFLVAYFKGYQPAILWCPQTPPIGSPSMPPVGIKREIDIPKDGSR